MTADLHIVAAQLARDPECPLRAALARHLHTVAGLLGETVAADPVDVREMPAREVYARWRGVVREAEIAVGARLRLAQQSHDGRGAEAARNDLRMLRVLRELAREHWLTLDGRIA